METVQLLDVVALTVYLPERGLLRGQVGTLIEALSENTCEVEFVDAAGRTYAQLPPKTSQFMLLRCQPAQAA